MSVPSIDSDAFIFVSGALYAMYYEEDGDNCDEPNEQWEHVDECIPPEHVQHDYCNTALPTDILWVKYYDKEKYDAIEKCKKAAVARAKTKKTKGEFIYCVCATVLQKREYVVRIRTEEYMYMCTHGVHTYISNASSLQFVHKLFFSIFIFLYVMYLFDTSGETVHYYIHVHMYIHFLQFNFNNKHVFFVVCKGNPCSFVVAVLLHNFYQLWVRRTMVNIMRVRGVRGVKMVMVVVRLDHHCGSFLRQRQSLCSNTMVN
jgi:hypothetical protein